MISIFAIFKFYNSMIYSSMIAFSSSFGIILGVKEWKMMESDVISDSGKSGQRKAGWSEKSDAGNRQLEQQRRFLNLFGACPEQSEG